MTRGEARSAKFLESRYWVLATLAEAHIGSEDDRKEKKVARSLRRRPRGLDEAID